MKKHESWHVASTLNSQHLGEKNVYQEFVWIVSCRVAWRNRVWLSFASRLAANVGKSR
jgi:hypothetical protein